MSSLTADGILARLRGNPTLASHLTFDQLCTFLRLTRRLMPEIQGHVPPSRLTTVTIEQLCRGYDDIAHFLYFSNTRNARCGAKPWRPRAPILGAYNIRPRDLSLDPST